MLWAGNRLKLDAVRTSGDVLYCGVMEYCQRDSVPYCTSTVLVRVQYITVPYNTGTVLVAETIRRSEDL